jgi:hypothetical protein
MRDKLMNAMPARYTIPYQSTRILGGDEATQAVYEIIGCCQICHTTPRIFNLLSLAFSVNGTVHQAIGHILVLASNKLAWIMKGSLPLGHSFAVLQDFFVFHLNDKPRESPT